MALNPYSEVYNRNDDSGSAFVLGPNEALGDLKEHVKGVLGELARNRIQTQKALNAFGNLPMKGAMSNDLLNVLPQSKAAVQNAAKAYFQKVDANTRYAQTPEGAKEAEALRQAQITHESLTDKSVNDQTELTRALNELNANPDKYDLEKAKTLLGQFYGASPTDPIRQAPINLPKKGINYAKFLETGEKLIPDNVIKTPSQGGLIETEVQNKMFDANGKPTDYFTTQVQPKVESYLAGDDGQEAIKQKRIQNKLPDDTKGNEDAANLVRQDLYTSKNQKYLQTQKQPPEGEKKKAWSVNGNSLQNDKNVWHYDKNDNGEIFTMSHTDTSENKPLDFELYDAKGNAIGNIKGVPTRMEIPKGGKSPKLFIATTEKKLVPDETDADGNVVKQHYQEVPVEKEIVASEYNASKIENEFGKNVYAVRKAVTGTLDPNSDVKTGKTGGEAKSKTKFIQATRAQADEAKAHLGLKTDDELQRYYQKIGKEVIINE